MPFKDDIPPTSKEEADARRVRPPPGKYDPDNLSHWSITMMVAWIIWREIDAVRNEWDSYRSDCADWLFFRSDSTTRKKVAGDLAPQNGSWDFRQWKPSGWNGLRRRALSQNIPPQVAIDSLWQSAGEDRIRATAIECKNAKTFDGNLIEIPAHYWARLKRADDPSGKATLFDDNGRVYREVQFLRLDGKRLWPKSPPLSREPLEHVENPEPKQTRPAEPELLKPTAWLDDARKDNKRQKNEPLFTYAHRLHALMQTANVTKRWKFETMLRRLHDK
jgi:hypothetical protein